MIRGYKPAANFVTFDGDGFKIEGEQRQCVHCQFLWEYRPGSGTTRGYCLRCDGLLCARPECARIQRMMLRQVRSEASCLSWTDYIDRLRDQYVHHPLYQVTPGGIVVPR